MTPATPRCAGCCASTPRTSLDILFSADYIHDAHNNGAEVLLYGNNPNPNTYAPNGASGMPFDSRFLCGKWCNYTTLGNRPASFDAGLIPPLEWLPDAGDVRHSSSTPSTRYDFSLNVDVGITDAVKVNSITGYHNWTNTFSIDGDLSPAQTQFGNNTLTTGSGARSCA